MLILIAESDANTRAALTLSLESNGHVVEAIGCGDDVQIYAKDLDLDIIVLDGMLCDMSGLDVIRRLRAAKIATPVIMVSAEAGIADKVAALRMGADDYLTKPFHRDELLARIDAVSRRHGGHATSVIEVGDLVIDRALDEVKIGGVPLRMTATERKVLYFFAERKGRLITKQAIYDRVYGQRGEVGFKIVDVFICKLRARLRDASGGKNYLQPEWGRGYILREPHECPEPPRYKPPGVTDEMIRAGRAAADAEVAL